MTEIKEQQISTDLLVSVSREMSGALGEEFLQKLVVEMSKALYADFVFIGRADPVKDEVTTIAMAIDQKPADNITYELADTPCENVVSRTVCCHASGVAAMYPKDIMLADLGIEGYLGSPLFYKNGDLLGLMVAMYKKPITNQYIIEALFDNYSARVAAEIEALDRSHELEELNETLEQKVDQRTRIFRAMNQELEGFIDMITHELKAPLRSIKGFSQILDEDFGKDLPTDAQDHLNRILANSKKMEEQINALMELGQITHKEYVLAQLDISKIAHEVVDEVVSAEDKAKYAISIEENLKCIADRGAAHHLLRNMICNALKYSGSEEQPEIHIGKDEDGWLYIKDNGIGFSQEYAEKMFQPFQRIHASAELAGTGIGMATCQRIINKHGGQIKAQGAVGEGAKISFTFMPEHGE